MGTSDIPLNDTGRKQAHHISTVIADQKPHVILSSPVLRAMETAQIIHTKTPKLKLMTEPLLRERAFGIYEGKTYEYIEQHVPRLSFNQTAHYPNLIPPEGESIVDVARRVESLLVKLRRDFNGQKVVLVTHGMYLRVFLSNVLGIPIHNIIQHDITNGSVTVIEDVAGKPGVLHRLGYTGR